MRKINREESKLNIITIEYSKLKEEAFPKFLKQYDEMHDVIKIDCLVDAIYHLEKEKEKIGEK